MKPGIYDIPSASYHADPCPTPSLSNSIAKILLSQSPLHAMFAHSRLNPHRAATTPTPEMEMGSVLHGLFLGNGAEIVVVQADNWTTKAARLSRDEAREEGKIPLLEKDFERANKIHQAAWAQIQRRDDCAPFFEPGRAENTMMWQEGDSWCRAMVDWMPEDPRAPLLDFKFTSKSANPTTWARNVVQNYRTQAAFYRRGSLALRGEETLPMRFIVVETEAPHAVSVITLAPSLMAVAEADVERAIRIWGACMKSGVWPGYPHLAHAEAPGWLLNEMSDRDLRDEIEEIL